MSKLALSSLFLACASTWAAPALVETIERTYAVGPKVTLSVRNTDGTIYIYGSDQDEIKISARKKAYTKERLDGISVQVNAQGDSVRIETAYPPKPEGLTLADRSGTVDYFIIVPQTCTLTMVELGDGEIILEGLRGESVTARLANGIINARNCFSQTNVTVAAGGIDLIFDWWEESAFSLSAAIGNGNVRAAFPPELAVSLDAAAGNGHVRNVFAAGDEKGSGVRSVQTVIGNGTGAAFQLRATNGNITIEKSY